MRPLKALLTLPFVPAIAESPLGEQQQQPLTLHERWRLLDELKKAEIIPTVFDVFKPYVTVSVSWDRASAEVGNTIKPKRVQALPVVNFVDVVPEFPSQWTDGDHAHLKYPQLTLALTDPDARSRDNPDWSEMCHWIATDLPLSTTKDGGVPSNYTEIMPYKAPGPPPKTGKHRYVFAALAPTNGTCERLNLTTPTERQHWGYGKERSGLREWAAENGLTIIGANFMYAQNKKQ